MARSDLASRPKKLLARADAERRRSSPAFTLYSQTLGFEIHDIEKGYYADKEDAYDMRKMFAKGLKRQEDEKARRKKDKAPAKETEEGKKAAEDAVREEPKGAKEAEAGANGKAVEAEAKKKPNSQRKKGKK